jgi:hypothetical protein
MQTYLVLFTIRYKFHLTSICYSNREIIFPTWKNTALTISFKGSYLGVLLYCWSQRFSHDSRLHSVVSLWKRLTTIFDAWKKDNLMHLIVLCSRFKLLNVEVKLGLIFDKFVSRSKVVHLLATLKEVLSIKQVIPKAANIVLIFSQYFSLIFVVTFFITLVFIIKPQLFRSYWCLQTMFRMSRICRHIDWYYFTQKRPSQISNVTLFDLRQENCFWRDKSSPASQTTFRRNTPVFRDSCQYFNIHKYVSSYNFTFKQYVIQNLLLAFPVVWLKIPVNSKFFKD